jgi:basic amino acid/polyamine antiporter, APA family
MHMGQKKLHLFDLTMIVVSLTIGMGIFRTPVVVAAKAGTPFIFFMAWLIGGLVALCGALTYAEIGSRYPVTGGYYRIFSYGYHPSLAFAVNCIILVSNAASVAIVAVIGSEYIGYFFYKAPPPEIFKQCVTIGAVAIFYIINLLGLKMSSRVQNGLTLIKITLILLLLLSITGHHPVAIVHNNPATSYPPAVQPLAINHSSADTHSSPVTQLFADRGATVPHNPGVLNFLKALGVGLIAVSFTYGGYQQTINFGGDVKEPSRILPRGISYGIMIIIVLYLSINLVYTQVIGFENLKTADSIAAILFNHLFGPVGENILRILMFLSVLAYVNVLMMSNPRVMFAMSEEGILPPPFKLKTRRHDVIFWSLTAFSLVIIITLLFSSTVEKIINYTIFLDCIGMSTSAATIFILRRRKMGERPAGGTGGASVGEAVIGSGAEPAREPGGKDAGQKGGNDTVARPDIYRMKLFPLLPLIFILAYIAVGASIILDDPLSAAYGALIFGCFFGLYFVVNGIKKARRGV